MQTPLSYRRHRQLKQLSHKLYARFIVLGLELSLEPDAAGEAELARVDRVRTRVLERMGWN